MDMSSSITSKNYPKEKNFVKNVADTFSISRAKTDVGVVTYNRDAKLWISFGQYNNNEDFKKAVDEIPYWGGSTRIDNGLEMAAVELFGTIKGERAKLPNVLILLTDGKQNSDPRATPLEDAVLPLFQLGVKVFAVGVGDQISRDELRLIVEKDRDIFTVDDFDDLLAKSHQIARAACDEVQSTERKSPQVLGLLLWLNTILSSGPFGRSNPRQPIALSVDPSFVCHHFGCESMFVSFITQRVFD